ncbi:hypothetical protein BOX15_Mlig033669g3 [Macrostomum lignano]|uniref:Thioredoxin domain-containing protein n=2 Tax=Macrostomum lignano TaxID=282301 RepID=A0A1I8J0I1_9PLAT|nr:hypothetical protein BOX15_Mlig033669g3 [Macrostomum lignano]
MSQAGDTVPLVEEITDQTGMYTALAQAKSRPLLACFSASWCQPCRAFAPKLERLAKQYCQVVFVKLDVDKMKDLANQHGVEVLPTFVLFKNGYRVGSVSGTVDGKIEALLSSHGTYPIGPGGSG